MPADPPGQEGSRYDVFVSYSSADKAVADTTCRALEQQGLRCRIAPRDIFPGTEYGQAIVQGIDATPVLLLLSAKSNQSAHVRREVERAISKGRAVVPCRIEDVQPTGALEYALGNTQWMDAFTPPLASHLDRVAAAIRGLQSGTASGSVLPALPVAAPVVPTQPAMVPAARELGRTVWATVTGRVHTARAAWLALDNRRRNRFIGIASAVATGLVLVVGLWAVTGRSPANNSAGPNPPAQVGTVSSTQTAQSQFSKDKTEGWTTTGYKGRGDVTSPVTLQNLGDQFWVTATGRSDGPPAWFWVAPAKFRGDQSDKFGRVLRFSIGTGGSGKGENVAPGLGVVLRGGSVELIAECQDLKPELNRYGWSA